jgi:phosphoglycolate phosphatase
MVSAIFFDLDGTFADTAPDLAHALNSMRQARGMAPLRIEATRPVTSLGARGIIGVGFGITPDHSDEKNLCRETRLFTGVEEALDAIEARGVNWGIVTNKAERFARPLIALLGYGARAACVIGGDTTGKIKPHPEPLLAACRALGVPSGNCVYVGDDERDIVAGRAAGMRTVAVRYGYLNGGSPDAWGADTVIDEPRQLSRLL